VKVVETSKHLVATRKALVTAGALVAAIACGAADDDAGQGAPERAGAGGQSSGSAGHAGVGGGYGYCLQCEPLMCTSVDSTPSYGSPCGVDGNHCHERSYGSSTDYYCCDGYWSRYEGCMPPPAAGTGGESGQGGDAGQSQPGGAAGG